MIHMDIELSILFHINFTRISPFMLSIARMRMIKFRYFRHESCFPPPYSCRAPDMSLNNPSFISLITPGYEVRYIIAYYRYKAYPRCHLRTEKYKKRIILWWKCGSYVHAWLKDRNYTKLPSVLSFSCTLRQV